MPECIDNRDFRHLKIDEKYVISLSITVLPKIAGFIEVLEVIGRDHIYDMSIYIKKEDTNKILDKVVENINITSGELETSNKNQRDVEILDQSQEELKKLRKKIQLDNEEVYSINIILSFYSNNLVEIQKKISYFRAKLYSKNLNSQILNFRHLDGFITNLPLSLESNINKSIGYFTTSSVSNIFPFYQKQILDNFGIILGYTTEDNKLCIIDIFSRKYTNSNMCIIGSSGSGKTYFSKLLLFRHYVLGKRQFVFDLEGEYRDIVISLGGTELFKEGYFNILEITSYELVKFEKEYLSKKIEYIINFLVTVVDLTMAEIDLLKNTIDQLYNSYKITSDKDSILKKEEGNRIFLKDTIIDKDKFPTLCDMLKVIKNIKLKKKLKAIIENELKYLSKTTTIDVDNTLFCISTSELITKEHYITIDYILSYISDFLLENVEGTIIYIDEIWKYMLSPLLAEKIFLLYKTIRKRNASIIGITQDITDLFKHNKKEYGKGILNNSAFKVFFKTNYNDIELLKDIVIFPSDDIIRLEKGQAIMCLSNSHIKINIIASVFEKEILKDENSSSFR